MPLHIIPDFSSESLTTDIKCLRSSSFNWSPYINDTDSAHVLQPNSEIKRETEECT